MGVLVCVTGMCNNEMYSGGQRDPTRQAVKYVWEGAINFNL